MCLDFRRALRRWQDTAGRAWRWRAASAGADGAVSAVVAPGPREVGLRRREDRAEDSDDAANLARLTAVVDQDEADHRGHDGAVHQVLPRNRRGSPQSPTEDHVDDQRGRHGAILARGYSWRGRPLDSVLREGQENGQEAAQHQEQLVRLLRAEFGYGPSCLVAVGHFAPPTGGAR